MLLQRTILVFVASLAVAVSGCKEPPPAVSVSHLHAIARPDAEGRWYIQNDVDHAPWGIVAASTRFPRGVEQGADASGPFLRIYFDRAYSHAGAINVTTDDDFGPSVSAHSNLGTNNATIRLYVGGKMVDPATVRPINGGGNLWVIVTMLQRNTSR